MESSADLLVSTILLVISAFVFYALVASAVASGNRELIITIKESTSKICEELRKVRESNENK